MTQSDAPPSRRLLHARGRHTTRRTSRGRPGRGPDGAAVLLVLTMLSLTLPVGWMGTERLLAMTALQEDGVEVTGTLVGTGEHVTSFRGADVTRPTMIVSVAGTLQELPSCGCADVGDSVSMTMLPGRPGTSAFTSAVQGWHPSHVAVPLTVGAAGLAGVAAVAVVAWVRTGQVSP